ncbi:hypothetical protein ASF90_16640 [Xanthomonas sp. Leaf148]|nr:hypothetical protein ASF90_16640 [Xanthomonas sp. Leaf148]
MKLLVATVWSGLISAAAALADTRRSRSGAYRMRCSDMAGAAATGQRHYRRSKQLAACDLGAMVTCVCCQ